MSSDPRFTISSSSRELENAHRFMREGRLSDAEAAFRRVLETEPEQTEALRFLANAALARGAAGQAVELLNRAAAADRNDVGVLMELGVAYRAADRRDESRYVLERALQASNGRNTTARLLLANVLELDQRPELALAHYFRAILEAQHAGQWLGDDSTEPGLRQLVRHAMRYVADGRRALFDAALQPVRQRGAPLDRVERALAIYLRESNEAPADARQRPSFLYVPGLGAAPFGDAAQCEWLPGFLQRIADAHGEIDVCLAASTPGAASGSASPFSLGNMLAAQAPEAPPPERRVPVYQRGLLHEAPRQHAPRLLAALADAPLVHIARHGPDVELIEVAARSRSTMRYGRTNSRCGVAVALPGAPMRVLVGGEARTLGAGQAALFDPSFGVEYASDGDAPARVLSFEIWHPGLGEHEREALSALTAAAVEFDGRVQDLD